MIKNQGHGLSPDRLMTQIVTNRSELTVGTTDN